MYACEYVVFINVIYIHKTGKITDCIYLSYIYIYTHKQFIAYMYSV